ncbi:MAG: hypothetical protein MUE50_16340 [Pirellulaceae bacterium]|nr:hypothetical protein [Pirellulaceae bacterium]
MAHITRLMNAAVHSTVLPAVVTLALSLLSGSAGAQADWQTGPNPSSYVAPDAPSSDPPASAARGDLLRLPAVEDADVGPSTYFDSSVRLADFVPEMNDAADELPDDAQFYTIDELREEMKKLAWVKGDYKIVPYGVIWGSAIYATKRTFPGFFVLYSQSPEIEGENDFEIDTRRTRLGLDVTGPKVAWFGGAETAGRVEIDFHGQFLTENQSTIQIRHAYAEAKNEDWRVMAGQNWDLISPLLPSTVNYSVGWDGGNIGFRRMELRLERYLRFSDTWMISLQGAACQNIVPEGLSRVYTASGGGVFDRVIKPESVAWPLLESRVGCTLGPRGAGCQPIAFGVSGHIGQQGFDYRPLDGNPFPPEDDVRIPTWSFNIDARVPVSDRFGVQGEFFTGQNLGTFFGGIGQGVNLATKQGIHSTGGWGEVWYDLSPALHYHLGYGIDNPLDADITAAVGRTFNSFGYTNLIVDVTKKLNLGFEVSYWTTRYLGLEEGNSVTFEFSGAYGF